jgi:hypothetical protein
MHVAQNMDLWCSFAQTEQNWGSIEREWVCDRRNLVYEVRECINTLCQLV